MAAAWVSLARCNQELLVNSSEGKLKPKKTASSIYEKQGLCPTTLLPVPSRDSLQQRAQRSTRRRRQPGKLCMELGIWLLMSSEVILYAVCFVCNSYPRVSPSKNVDLRMLSWSAQKAEEHNSTQRSEQMYGVEKRPSAETAATPSQWCCWDVNLNTLRSDFNPSIWHTSQPMKYMKWIEWGNPIPPGKCKMVSTSHHLHLITLGIA